MLPVADVGSLHAILPLEEIAARFDRPVQVEQLGVDRYDEIAARDPNSLLSTAFTVWQRHVQHHPEADPAAVRDYIRCHGGSFLDATRAMLGSDIIKDVSYSRCTIDDPALDHGLVAYLVATVVYPNNLHLADLNLVNPYKPLSQARRTYKIRRYKGLGLLGTVLARAEAQARSRQCEYITLTAAADDLVPLFAKFGFVVEDGGATSLAMEKRIRA